MLDLDLLKYKGLLKIESQEGKTKIFDPVRKKYLVLQPEEVVRQLILHYLVHEQQVPLRTIQVEKQFKYQNQLKRYDILVYKKTEPILLIECKSFDVKLSTQVVEQVSIYNQTLKIPYLMVSNGKENYIAEINFEKNSFKILDHFPELT